MSLLRSPAHDLLPKPLQVRGNGSNTCHIQLIAIHFRLQAAVPLKVCKTQGTRVPSEGREHWHEQHASYVGVKERCGTKVPLPGNRRLARPLQGLNGGLLRSCPSSLSVVPLLLHCAAASLMQSCCRLRPC